MAFSVCPSLEHCEEHRFSFHPMKIDGCEPPLLVRLDSYPPARCGAGGRVDNRIPVKKGGGEGGKVQIIQRRSRNGGFGYPSCFIVFVKLTMRIDARVTRQGLDDARWQK